jgi:hypothetical protein
MVSESKALISDESAGKKIFWQKAILLVYPFLLAYYPVLALRNHNIVYVDFSTILRTLIVVTAGTAIITLITFLLVRNLEKSSIIVSVVILLLLSYGHFNCSAISSAIPSGIVICAAEGFNPIADHRPGV